MKLSLALLGTLATVTTLWVWYEIRRPIQWNIYDGREEAFTGSIWTGPIQHDIDRLGLRPHSFGKFTNEWNRES